MSFTVYPAIDVRDGKVVRLFQGDYARQTSYAADPYDQAMAYADAGARWLHLVDLDAAREGGYTLAPLLRRIAMDGRLRVQTGGGVRSRDDVSAILEAGASRVVVGSLAVREPCVVEGWIADFGGQQITVALDTRQDDAGQWQLPVHGWTETGDRTLDQAGEHFAARGLRHLLCTDIARDGMLTGPNIGLYRHLHAQLPAVALQASGGASCVDDIRHARDAGCAGIVLGKALLEGRFTLQEALAC